MKLAILIADGFEQVEMTEPRKALDEGGADTSVVSLKPGRVRAWKFVGWGDEFPVDITLEHADPASFDALLLPGGVINPDTLRVIPKAVSFSKHFFDNYKPVASICHGPRTIIERVPLAADDWHPGPHCRLTSGTPGHMGRRSRGRRWQTS